MCESHRETLRASNRNIDKLAMASRFLVPALNVLSNHASRIQDWSIQKHHALYGVLKFIHAG